MPKRILILTASMGEGHNTAARNVRDALLREGDGSVQVLMADPYTRTNPTINKLIQRGYNTAINRYPHAWKVLFSLLSKRGLVEGMSPMMTELISAVEGLIEEFKPDIIGSTYPVFSLLINKIRKKNPAITAPFYTIITDSTQINSTWYRWACDGSLVADEPTAETLRKEGVPGDKIHVLGFPVSMAFEGLTPTPPPNGKWKALLFPGGRLSHTMATLEGLAEIRNLEITVITGRRRKIFRALQEAGLPKYGNLVGWTDEMPRLMTSHHVFIGKAGGATVQEALAAQIPFLVSHVVPGQEEGNIAMIESSGIGALAVGAPGKILRLVEGMQANDGAIWKAWRSNMAALSKPSAARAIAQFLLQHAHEKSKK